MKKIGVLLVLVLASLSAAQTSRPTVYLEPQQGFETHIAAAIAKKSVPVHVVTDKNKAIYILRSAPVEVKSESMFANCAGIEDKGNVSVQLIAASSTKMVLAYSINKQRGGSKNQQSMAEAVAKHFKESFLSGAPAIAEAPAPTPAPAVAEVPVPTPVPAAVAPAPPPAPVAYQQQSNVHVESATQSRTQIISQDESLADAARRATQHKSCLDLAKDNPSITRN
jgi:hypothetical protein